jgi:DNA-binding MarR family transcriptional regulator
METYNETDSITHFDQLVPLLEQIESDPDITQAILADRLDVSVGMVNLYIKRLVSKGYVKVKRAQRRKLRYIITPEGIALRARLTVNYLESSLSLYRRTRQRVRELLVQVKQAGYDSVCIEGESDIADICRLTCLEQSIATAPNRPVLANREALPIVNAQPVLEVRGTKVHLHLPG